jgi:hypothetical protein
MCGVNKGVEVNIVRTVDFQRQCLILGAVGNRLPLDFPKLSWQPNLMIRTSEQHLNPSSTTTSSKLTAQVRHRLTADEGRISRSTLSEAPCVVLPVPLLSVRMLVVAAAPQIDRSSAC